MSSKICTPCRQAFASEPRPLDRDSTIAGTPFHEAPWKAFQTGADISESVKGCDFCSFVVAFAAADQALGRHGNGSFADSAGHLSADLGLSRSNLRHMDRLDIRLFGTEDPRVKCHRPIKKTSTSTSSETSFECLCKWIKNCSENHKSCNKLHARTGENKNWLPARLVKIIPDTDSVPEIIKVVETNTDDGIHQSIEYATLSYCWGREPFTKLLRSNIEKMTTTGMSIQDLPATFRDAITVANRLGMEYIWIDALCIIQLDAEDWGLHSVTMAKVYSYSAITLAASGSSEQLTTIVPREQYLNGLWRKDSLPLSLLWCTQTEDEPPSIRVAPSWSWASVYTPVDFNFLFRAQTEPKVVTKVIDIIIPDDEPESIEMSRPTALILQGPLTEVRFRSASRSALGPLHSNWWMSHKTMEDRIKFLNPIDLAPMLVFIGKGLKADYPCAISLDREVPKNSRMFALKIAEADIRHPWQQRLPSECGLLLIADRERGTFRRIGMFEIAAEKMKRDWADQKTPFTSISKLREEIWRDSGTERRFYLERDEKDGYTIKIV
ncbi:related to tol protein [Fusarium fujikuroi]|nr:related to tol protein [Fusarium fujikuroi]SCO21937.1 related to tol protein [Fusarium fujikuroi]